MEEVTGFEHPVSIAGSVCWQNLEQFAREQVQAFIQRLLEEEVAALLGRQKSQRREAGNLPAAPPEAAEAPPAAPVYRNGYGKPRRLATPCGTVTLRRPR